MNNYPRVTELLQIIDPLPMYTEEARERGDFCHEISERYLRYKYLKEELPPYPITDAKAKIALAHKETTARIYNWIDTNVEEVLHVEEETCNHEWKYRGHPDAIVKLKGYKRPSVLEDKFTAVLKRLAVTQGCAYLNTEHAKQAGADNVVILHINPDGKVREFPFNDTSPIYYKEWASFCSCVNVYYRRLEEKTL